LKKIQMKIPLCGGVARVLSLDGVVFAKKTKKSQEILTLFF